MRVRGLDGTAVTQAGPREITYLLAQMSSHSDIYEAGTRKFSHYSVSPTSFFFVVLIVYESQDSWKHKTLQAGSSRIWQSRPRLIHLLKFKKEKKKERRTPETKKKRKQT